MTSELSHEFEADVAAGDFDSLGQKPDSRPRPDYYRGMGLLVLRGVRMVLLGLLVLHSVRMVLLGLFVLCGVSEWCSCRCSAQPVRCRTVGITAIIGRHWQA